MIAAIVLSSPAGALLMLVVLVAAVANIRAPAPSMATYLTPPKAEAVFT